MSRYWRMPEDYRPTPFQQILLDIMRDNWPQVMGPYDLARRIDVSGPTVVQWLRKDVVTHDAGILGRISMRFGVPFGVLYEAVGLQMELPPPPAPYTPVQAPVGGGDQWDDAYARIRALPMPPEIAEQVISEMQRTRAQAERRTRTQRYVDAEHTVQPFDGATEIMPVVAPSPGVMPAAQHQPQQHQRAPQARRVQPGDDTPDMNKAELRERRGHATSGGRARTKR